MGKPGRTIIEAKPLEEIENLKGKRIDFESVAEMITVRAQEIPDKTHVIFYDQNITYSQTNGRANRVANYLKSKGISRGDVVSLLIMNSPEIYYTMFGVQKLGAIAQSINFLLQGPEIAYILDDSRPKIVFVGSEFMQVFAAGYRLAEHKPEVVEVITEAEHPENLSSITLQHILETYPDDEALVPQKGEDPFLLLYSSGTTGRPKGILLSNRGQLTLCKSMASLDITTGEDSMLILLPMFHTNPICVWTYPCTYMGLTLCIRKSFSPADFWPSIVDNRLTYVMGVPAMYSFVFNAIDTSGLDLSDLRLKYGFCGAAPMPADLIEKFYSKFNVKIIEAYGLTEACGVSTLNPPFGKSKAGSIGVALPYHEVTIRDGNNNEMQPGENGEICIKGETVMLRYLNNEKATAESVVDGWLHTGDMGYMDEEGFLFIVDRKNDIINRGGENIYPREVEILIESYPGVQSVAVIGVQDPDLGERVKAYIIPSPSAEVNTEELRVYLADKLAKYKIPEFVEIVKDLPRSPTGKVLKRELRKLENKVN